MKVFLECINGINVKDLNYGHIIVALKKEIKKDCTICRHNAKDANQVPCLCWPCSYETSKKKQVVQDSVYKLHFIKTKNFHQLVWINLENSTMRLPYEFNNIEDAVRYMCGDHSVIDVQAFEDTRQLGEWLLGVENETN